MLIVCFVVCGLLTVAARCRSCVVCCMLCVGRRSLFLRFVVCVLFVVCYMLFDRAVCVVCV